MFPSNTIPVNSRLSYGIEVFSFSLKRIIHQFPFKPTAAIFFLIIVYHHLLGYISRRFVYFCLLLLTYLACSYIIGYSIRTSQATGRHKTGKLYSSHSPYFFPNGFALSTLTWLPMYETLQARLQYHKTKFMINCAEFKFNGCHCFNILY